MLGCAYAVSGSFSFSTASPAFDSVIGFDAGSPYMLLGYKIYNTSPANHSIDMNDQGTFNNLLSGYVSAA